MISRMNSLLIVFLLLVACQQSEPPPVVTAAPQVEVAVTAEQNAVRPEIYATVPLQADLSHLSDRQREMLPLLIQASDIMGELFWLQTWGDRGELLESITDPSSRRFAEINYGPWDRLDGDKPFIEGVGEKPPGARFYPQDMSKAEFEVWNEPAKKGQYSLVRRDEQGVLTLEPYHVAYATQLAAAATLLREAAELAEDPEFADYLRLRAEALVSDDYRPSDMAWMDMKNNAIELVIGAIENYEDQLYGYRSAYEAYVLIKDPVWSKRLARFASYLPELQRSLPAPERYKQEMPGSDADLGAYDVVFTAGNSDAGGKTIAINLPNDEAVQLAKGTRRLQLKNAMRAKFDQILVPIADLLIAGDQRQHITFDAFFSNVMFHEVAHGLGIKNTLDGTATVREALEAHASAIEEGKADILGLYMVQELRKKGEISEGVLMDNYVTFMAGIFRSVRFGASSSHGKANMIRFNFFDRAGAFSRDAASGTYRIHVPAFEQAVKDLSEQLLVLQGDGDLAAVEAFIAANSGIGPQLQSDLDRLAAADIPVDIVFEQGEEVLGL
jgi:hypothetical protein